MSERRGAPDPLAVAGADFRDDIQGLRGVAVLLVVLYHAGMRYVTGGFIGVDVFFVVSGYVITGLLYRELQSTHRLDLPRFYGRRIRRLLPAAALVLAVTFAGFWLIYSPVERQRLGAVSLATALYISNVWFALYATDYLGGDASSNPLLHTWSLAVEEQFYLVWPCAMLLMARITRASGLRTRMVLGIALLSALSFVGAVVTTRISQPWAFFGSPTRAWEFGAGALAFFAYQRDWGWGARARAAVTAVGMTLVIGSAVVLDENSVMPGFVALPCVGGTVAVIVAAKRGDFGVCRFLSSRPMVWLGDLSYGWYLWHWPMLVAIRELDEAKLWWPPYLGLLASLGLAWWMYRMFENPIRHSVYLSRRPFASVLLGVVITATSASVAFAGRERARVEGLAPEQIPIKRAQVDGLPKLEATGCHATTLQTSIPSDCRFGKKDAETVIALFGDSHAEHWFPALQEIAEDRGVALISLTKSLCPTAAIEPYLRNFRRRYRECTEWRQNAINELIAAKPRLVVMSNASTYEDFLRKGEDRAQAWAMALDATLAQFERAQIDVVLLRDTPGAPFDVPVCLSRAVARGHDPRERCSFDRAARSNDEIYAAERSAVRAHGNVRIVDPSLLVCPEASCSVVRNGMIVFMDRSHLTATFSASLAHDLDRYIGLAAGRSTPSASALLPSLQGSR